MIAGLPSERVCLLGGSGFVGRSLAERLCAEGRSIRILTRSARKAKALQVLPTVELVVADPQDDAALARHFEGMDAVVNLVAILHQGRRQTFRAVHEELPRKVAGACRAAGVPRLLHMSALGASESGPSEYLRSKARGEAAVREAAGAISLTIFRPSVIFGARDTFLNLFLPLARAFPVIPLARARARFQPVWVEDVARAMAQSLDDPRTSGETYCLCGPKVYTLAEIFRLVSTLSGRDRAIVPLPDWAAGLQARVLELLPPRLLQPFFPVDLPGPLMTRDNLASMSVDSVCEGPFPGVFGFQPAALEAIAPGYLARDGLLDRHDLHRIRAGR